MWLGVFDTALRSGQEQADVPFIEAALAEVGAYISYIEKEHHAELCDDRGRLARARSGWACLTKMQVAWCACDWQKDIFKRYACGYQERMPLNLTT